MRNQEADGDRGDAVKKLTDKKLAKVKRKAQPRQHQSHFMVIVATPLRTQNPQPQIWPQHQKNAGLKSKIEAELMPSPSTGTSPLLSNSPTRRERNRQQPRASTSMTMTPGNKKTPPDRIHRPFRTGRRHEQPASLHSISGSGVFIRIEKEGFRFLICEANFIDDTNPTSS